jgi:predicted glycoside hydrolase/deacetylase ChbG (UPF0249 family)
MTPSSDRTFIGRTSGALIVNADDWGRNRKTTDAIRQCIRARSVQSASGMVFMEDSERAAAIALESNVDVGLHLNLTTPFSASNCPLNLGLRLQNVAGYLCDSRIAQLVFNPRIADDVRYVVSAQIAEFNRLYGTAPIRFDGHHHMHLSANVLMADLLPHESQLRRSFSSLPGERNLVNRIYRGVVNTVLAKRYRLTDFFFSMAPLQPQSRLQQIFELARNFVVELETHPVNPDELSYLTRGEFLARVKDCNLVQHCPTA